MSLGGRFLAAVTLVSAPSAQVFVVDAANRPGTHFTDLPPAVSAVPDGATLLVRDGAYTPFQIVGKGLSVLADGAVTFPSATSGIEIRQTGAQQTVLLRGLLLPFIQTRIVDTAGPVILDDCRSDPQRASIGLAPQVDLVRARDVQLHRVTLLGATLLGGPEPGLRVVDSNVDVSLCSIEGDVGLGGFLGQAGPGSVGAQVIRSRAVFAVSVVRGGRGGAGCRSCGLPGCSANGGTGGSGVEAMDSTLLLLATRVIGGSGGHGACCGGFCTCAGGGGPGVTVTDSRVLVLGVEPIGGDPGFGVCGGGRGPSAVLHGSNSVFLDPGAEPPSGEVTGTQQSGQTVAFRLKAPPGTPALLAVTTRPALVPFEPLGFGSLFATLVFTVGPFSVTGTGTLDVPWTVPLGLIGIAPHAGQFLTLQAQRLFVSNAFPVAVAR